VNGEQTIRKKQNVGLELKKEKVEHTKKKGGQFITHSPNEIASKLQSATPRKENTHTPFSKTYKKSLEPFSKKYIPDNPLAKKTRGEKSSTKPSQVAQLEESRIVLMDIDPYSLHAYWEITNIDKKKVLKQFDESSKPPRQIIRVYDVTYIHFDGKNAHSYFDIEINRNRGNWYIDLWSFHKSLYAEIGMKSSLGDFHPIARSNFIDTPRACQSSSDEERWMRVSGNYEEISMLPAKPRKGKNKPEETSSISSPMKEVESEDTYPSAEKEPLMEKTFLKKYSIPTPQQSHKEAIEPERGLIKAQANGSYEKKAPKADIKDSTPKNDVQDHNSKLQFISSRKTVKTETPLSKSPHHERVASSKEDFRKRLFPEIDTHYGSDIRWEEELKGKKKK